MRIFLLFLTLVVAGCTAKQVHYDLGEAENEGEASKIIEQVLMEQSNNHRIEWVKITPEYLSYGEGAVFNTAFSSNYATTKSVDINSRIYFDSIGEINLFTKRDWYIMRVFNHEGKAVDTFYTRSKHKAEVLIVSMNLFISRAR